MWLGFKFLKQAQPSDDLGYTELTSDSEIMSHNSNEESYRHVTAKSELVSQ